MAKILIVRLGALGDILHALPAVAGIRALLPDATIGWLIEERWTELLAARDTTCKSANVCAARPVVNLIHTINTRRLRNRFLHPGTLREFRALIKSIRSVR